MRMGLRPAGNSYRRVHRKINATMVHHCKQRYNKTTHHSSVTLILLTVLAWRRCKIESALKPMAAVSAALIIPNTAQ